MTRRWLWFACILVPGLLAAGLLFQVGPGEEVVVLRFGAPARTVREPGLHTRWPAPIDAIVRVDTRQRVLESRGSEFLTHDKKNVLVDAFLVWRVVDSELFLRALGELSQAEGRLGDLLHSALGELLNAHAFEALVSSERDEAMHQALLADLTDAVARSARETFGIHVQAVRILRLGFPPQNRQAVFARMQAERASIATGIRAEGEEESARIQTETQRQAAHVLAEARQRALEIEGEAEAQAARIYAEAYGEDPHLYLFLSQLDALRAGVGDDTTWILPGDHPALRLLVQPPELVPASAPSGH